MEELDSFKIPDTPMPLQRTGSIDVLTRTVVVSAATEEAGEIEQDRHRAPGNR